MGSQINLIVQSFKFVYYDIKDQLFLKELSIKPTLKCFNRLKCKLVHLLRHNSYTLIKTNEIVQQIEKLTYETKHPGNLDLLVNIPDNMSI